MSYWIPTFTGRLIDIRDPHPSLIDPVDIAVSLARKPRWNGHTELAYTVAEHSLLASYYVAPQHALCALLHDAAEAYLGDVSRPLKLLLGDAWRAIEDRFECAVARRFNLEWPWEIEVREVDDALLACERHGLLKPVVRDDERWPWNEPERCWWGSKLPTITPQKPFAVLTAFVERFEELSNEFIDRKRLPLRRKEWLALRKRGAA